MGPRWVSAYMVSYAVFRATTCDPMPSKSSQLYVPQVDNIGPSYTWQDAPQYAELHRCGRAVGGAPGLFMTMDVPHESGCDTGF